MTKFFVGQRVRVINAIADLQHMIGRQGQIVGEEVVGGTLDWITDIEDPHDGKRMCCTQFVAGEYLAPILPEGHRAGDYSLSELLDRCRAGEGVPA